MSIIEMPSVVNYYLQWRHFSGKRNGSIALITSTVRKATLPILLLLTVGLGGCTNTELTAAQQDMTSGNYAAAHDKLVAASHSPKLTAREWRELADGLCLTEVKIGPPQYPLAGQRQTCADAAARPGSSSGPELARIDSAEQAATKAEVDAALRSGDVAGAETAVVRYQLFPGADQVAIAEWSRDIWSDIERQEGYGIKHDRHLLPAIAAVGQRYPKMRAMNDAEFKQWVMEHATVSNTSLVDGIDMRKGRLDLKVASNSLPEVALNLDRFARINDAMVARCRCDGHTNIAVDGSGLPAYLLRLDAETHESEVLVMPQPH